MHRMLIQEVELYSLLVFRLFRNPSFVWIILFIYSIVQISFFQAQNIYKIYHFPFFQLIWIEIVFILYHWMQCIKFKYYKYLDLMSEQIPLKKSIAQHKITNSSRYTTKNIVATYLPNEAFTSKYDPDNEFIAFGCNNGTKLLYSIKQRSIKTSVQCPLQQPATCIKWRPTVNTKIKVLGVTNTVGIFQYYHVPSMKKLFSIQEKDNSLHCCDFSKSGEHFATAGKDAHIRIYDENTKSLTTDLRCAEWNHRGHSNRIFSVKFIDDNTIISGGWDSVIHLWDIREGKSVKSVFGAHVAGDSIDYNKGQILIGCYSAKNQIQIWDYNKFAMRQGINWTNTNEKDKVAYVYASSFTHFQDNSIIAGACGVNQVKVYRKGDNKYELSSLIQGLQNGCFSVDSSYEDREFVFTTSHDGMFIYHEQKGK